VRFMVDTGATMMVLNQADAEAVGLEPDTLDYFLRSQTANGEVSGAPVRLDTVRLGPFLDTDVRAVVNGGELRQSLLGLSYLDRYEGFRVEGEAMYLSRARR